MQSIINENYTEEFLKLRFNTESKYWKWYVEFIEYWTNRKIPKVFTEYHHAIPRCCEGNDDCLVSLTFREHFVAHWLLSKCGIGKYFYKLNHAFGFMASISTKGNREDAKRLNSHHFKAVKTANRLRCKGKKLSEEAKLKITEYQNNNKKFGEDNPFYGKHHTEEAKKKIADTHRGNTYNRGYKHTPEAVENMRKGHSNVSEETRKKQSESRKGKAPANRKNLLIENDEVGIYACMFGLYNASNFVGFSKDTIRVLLSGKKENHNGFKITKI